MNYSTLARSYEDKTFNHYSTQIERGQVLNEQVEQIYQELSNEDCFTLIEKIGVIFTANAKKRASLAISKQEINDCENVILKMLEHPNVAPILEKILRAEANSIVNN